MRERGDGSGSVSQRELEEPFDLSSAAQVVELASGRGLVEHGVEERPRPIDLTGEKREVSTRPERRQPQERRLLGEVGQLLRVDMRPVRATGEDLHRREPVAAPRLGRYVPPLGRPSSICS